METTATELHMHAFKHGGGGTLLGDPLKSDDSYACECGAKMTIGNLTPEQHFRMPSTIFVGEVEDWLTIAQPEPDGSAG